MCICSSVLVIFQKLTSCLCDLGLSFSFFCNLIVHGKRKHDFDKVQTVIRKWKSSIRSRSTIAFQFGNKTTLSEFQFSSVLVVLLLFEELH